MIQKLYNNRVSVPERKVATMTLTDLTTLDVTIKLPEDETNLIAIYSQVHGDIKTRDSEGSQRYDITWDSEPSMIVNIDGRDYSANGVILPKPASSDEPETMIVWVKTSPVLQPAGYYIFTIYAEYSTWGIKMDVLRVEDDDEGTIDDFLQLSIADKRRLLGLP